MAADWPLAANYSKMLQTPKVAFRAPDLQNCTIKTQSKQSKQPDVRSGQSAAVYQGVLPGGKAVAFESLLLPLFQGQ